jgi:hypothetical protein
MKLRGTILTGALAAVFALAGAGTAEAHDSCRDRIHQEEHKLQRDARKHGWNSRQVRNRRDKISRLQRQCGSFFGWRDNRGRDRDRRWDRDDDRRWRNGDRDRRDRRDRDGWYWDGRNWRRR